MFEAVCDCCGKKSMNTVMVRLEYIQNPSVCTRWDMNEAEVMKREDREQCTKKYLLCNDCYIETGFPNFAFGRDNWRKGLAERSKTNES